LLLLSTATEPELGALVGRLTRKHEEGKLGANLVEYFPPGSSVVVVVLDHKYLDRVGDALANADKHFGRAIETEDYDQLKEALSSSEWSVDEMINP
jgi:hypothetical protein